MIVGTQVGVVLGECESGVVDVNAPKRLGDLGSARHGEDVPRKELSLVLWNVILSPVMSIAEQSEDAEC